MFDILWSDPQHNEGCQPNGLRGAGTYFGPDVTHNFLQKNKLVFLVRSHECKHDGYEIVHSGKVSCNRRLKKQQQQQIDRSTNKQPIQQMYSIEYEAFILVDFIFTFPK